MASALTEAQIEAKKHLQRIIAAAVAAAWQGLPHYDREQVDQWLATVLPITAAANQQSVMLTQAFIARAAKTQPQPVDAQAIIAGIRNGAPPAEVYTRPFVTVWAALKSGKPWAQAVKMGQERATSAAVTDVQLSFTHTISAAGDMGGSVGGWARVPDSGACDFCQAAADQVYSTGDLMPLHNWCGCGVEPLDSGPVAPAPSTFSGPGGLTVAVRDHGELGPVLTNAADNFTTESEALAHSH